MDTKAMMAELKRIREEAAKAEAAALVAMGVTKDDLKALKALEAAERKAKAERAKSEREAVKIAKAKAQNAIFAVGDHVRDGFLFGVIEELQKDDYYRVRCTIGTRYFSRASGSRVWQYVAPDMLNASMKQAYAEQAAQEETFADRRAKFEQVKARIVKAAEAKGITPDEIVERALAGK